MIDLFLFIEYFDEMNDCEVIYLVYGWISILLRIINVVVVYKSESIIL